MIKRKRKKGQTLIYKKSHWKQKIDQHDLQKKENGGELMCSGRISSSWSAYGTHRANLVIMSMIVINEKRTELWLRQMEHTRGHLWLRYSATVNQVMVATVKLSNGEFNLATWNSWFGSNLATWNSSFGSNLATWNS